MAIDLEILQGLEKEPEDVIESTIDEMAKDISKDDVISQHIRKIVGNSQIGMLPEGDSLFIAILLSFVTASLVGVTRLTDSNPYFATIVSICDRRKINVNILPELSELESEVRSIIEKPSG